MIYRNLLGFLFVFFLQSAFSQTIPDTRMFDWSQAGLVEYCLTEPEQSIHFLDAGGDPSGAAPNDAILSAILDTLTVPTEIFFPSGHYLFNDQISLVSNCILKGNGATYTIFLFDLSEEKDLITVKGSAGDIIIDIVSSTPVNSTMVKLTDASPLSIGDYIIVADDDAALVNDPWAINTTGQICKIMHITGNNVILDMPLRRSYSSANDPFVRTLDMLENVGIEGLAIQQLNPTLSQRSNIFFRYAYNCYVRCVESYNTNYAHVELEHAAHCEVSGSYFQDAFSYADGGQGYGVLAHYAASDNLITDNVLKHLRHSMLVQAGANGNVFSYNYSEDPYWTGTVLPPDAAGDLVLHGNYPYANLFEGNLVQNIVVDDSHGLNGPFNTYFRNRAMNYGITFSNASVGNNMTFVGNEVTNTEFLKGLYLILGGTHFEYGNNIKGEITPDGTDLLPENSLYLDSAGQYYTETDSWPPIGIPNEINTHEVEAQDRFYDGELVHCTDCLIDVCGPPFTLEADLITLNQAQLQWNAMVDAVKYEIQYGTPDGGTWTNIIVLDTFILLSDLIEATEYEWQVRSRCPAGWTPYSDTSIFTTLSTNLTIDQRESMLLYPNPNNGQFNTMVSSPTAELIHIYLLDQLGSVVHFEVQNAPVSNQPLQIDVHVASGYYICEILSGQNLYRQQVIIKQ